VTYVLVAVVAFVLMEPATALLHRLLFHGPGFVLHRSHHRTRPGRLEANDVFPVVLAALTILVMAAGSALGVGALLAAGAGVTAYGAAYGAVHDLYIHRRARLLPGRVRWLEPLRAAHQVHHRHGGAPYGMLLPVVPARHRAVGPVAAAAPGGSAAGPAPDHRAARGHAPS
jgi:beta-carotene 3-hydroxylase